MSEQLQALFNQLKSMGATGADLEQVRGAALSIQQNQGIVAGSISGPVAIGAGASAIQGPSTPTTPPPASLSPDAAAPTQGKSGREKFLDRAMEIAKSAGSVAEAVSKIVAIAKPLGLG